MITGDSGAADKYDEVAYVYALNNTLYNEMLDPTTRYMDISDVDVDGDGDGDDDDE